MSDKKQKLGWRERASLLFGSNAEKEETQERTMHKAGIDIISDRKLENRVKLLMQFEDAITDEIDTENLEAYVKALMRRTDLINHAIMEIAAPYGRAGTLPQFSRMFHGWGRLYASSKSWLLRTEDTITKTDEEAHNFFKNNLYKVLDELYQTLSDPKALEEISKIRKQIGGIENETSYNVLEHGAIDKRMHVRFLHDVLQKHIWKDGFLILNKCFLDKDVSERSATVIQSMQPMQRGGEGLGSIPKPSEDY